MANNSNPNEMYQPMEVEKSSSKFVRKFKENPFMSAGLGVGGLVLAYMLSGVGRRGKGEKLSVYLIHTRLGVQGTIIGALALGMGYQIYQ